MYSIKKVDRYIRNSQTRDPDTSVGWIIIFVLIFFSCGQADAQRAPLLPPQTVVGVEFAVRSANLAMYTPGGNAPIPIARFSISMTNRGKSSIGIVIEPGPSGASTDTGLDFNYFVNALARGLHACDRCEAVRDSYWVVLQPGQTDNVLVPFISRGLKKENHSRAETADLTLVLLVKESGGGVTRVPLSWADIPIRNELNR